MKTVAWLALIIAIVALIIGWIAFNRSGEDLEAIVEQEVEEAMLEIRADLDRAGDEIDEEINEEVADDETATTTE